MGLLCTIFFEHYLWLRYGDRGENQAEVSNELPKIYLDVEESDFGHLRVLAPASVLKLYFAGAQSRDPAEIQADIAIDVQLPAGCCVDCG